MADGRRGQFLTAAIVLCLLLAAGGWLATRPAVGQAAGHGSGLLPGVEPQIAGIMALLSQGKSNDLFQRTSLAPAAAREQIDTQLRQLASVVSEAGKYTGYNIVAVQTLGDRFEEVYVLAQFENEPIVMRFGFYRAPAAWQVLRFSVQTDLDRLLDSLPLQRP